MAAADVFIPGQWTNFFLLVGTGAVTLTGLVFVAMSLNVKVIARDATHRNRAINTLTGLALVFLRCALVLMGGQNHRAIGAELFVVCGISAAIFAKGYVTAIRESDGLRLSRVVGGSLVHVAEMIGAAFLLWIPGRPVRRGGSHRRQHLLHDHRGVVARDRRLRDGVTPIPRRSDTDQRTLGSCPPWARLAFSRSDQPTWWALRDSNPRPAGCKPAALTN